MMMMMMMIVTTHVKLCQLHNLKLCHFIVL